MLEPQIVTIDPGMPTDGPLLLALVHAEDHHRRVTKFCVF